MDDKTYKIISKAYSLFLEKKTAITDSEVSYILGLLEAALEYNSDDEDAPKKKSFMNKLGID